MQGVSSVEGTLFYFFGAYLVRVRLLCKKILEGIRMKNRRVYKVLLCGIVFLFFLFAFVGCEALFGNNIQEDVNVKLTLSNYDEYFSFTTRREQTGTTVLPYVTYREMNGVYQDAEYHNVVIKVSVPQTYGDDEIRNYTANIGGYCSFAWSDTYSILKFQFHFLGTVKIQFWSLMRTEVYSLAMPEDIP